MKSNIIKYIFIVIVIGLIGYSVYVIYGRENQNTVDNTIQEQKKQEEIKTNIKIPVSEFDTINPILSKNQNIQDISRLIYEPLFNIDKEYKLELCLAKEWSKTSDTSYLIKLNENVKWQDGSKFTAKDIQFTIDRLKDSNVSSIYAYNVQYVNSVEVIDDNTVRINLSQEVPFFEYNLTFPIMSCKFYENSEFTSDEKNNTPVGTGRFKVTSNQNDRIILKKNQNWWNIENEEQKLTQIDVIKYSNMGEVYNAFKIGNIHLINTQSLNIEDYIGTIGYATKDYYGRELDYIAFNCNNSVLSNKEVRQAIYYGIDKQNIIGSIYANKYYVSNFPLDYGNYICKDIKNVNEYNQDKAKEILTSNGWEYKSKAWQKVIEYRTQKIKLDLVVKSSNDKRIQVAENIKSNLEILGIKINIIKASDSQYQNYLKNKNYDMILTGLYAPYSPDLSKYFAQDNLANFNNEEVKQIMNEVKNIKDEKLLQEKYKKIIEIFNQEMPYVFLYYSRGNLIYNTNLKGNISPNSYNIFNNIETWYM